MKKIKKLPILLALLMVLCVVPAVESKADVRYKIGYDEFAFVQTIQGRENYVGYFDSYNNYTAYMPSVSTDTVIRFAVSPHYNYKVRIQIYNSNNKSVYDKTKNNTKGYKNVDFAYPNLGPDKYRVVVSYQTTAYDKREFTVTLYTYYSQVGAYTKTLAHEVSLTGVSSYFSVAPYMRAYELSVGKTYLRAVATEFVNNGKVKNTWNAGNQSYVNALYSGVLGRKYDQAGRDYWTGLLDNKIYSRLDVLNGFLSSPECMQKARNLGINW